MNQKRKPETKKSMADHIHVYGALFMLLVFGFVVLGVAIDTKNRVDDHQRRMDRNGLAAVQSGTVVLRPTSIGGNKTFTFTIDPQYNGNFYTLQLTNLVVDWAVDPDAPDTPFYLKLTEPNSQLPSFTLQLHPSQTSSGFHLFNHPVQVPITCVSGTYTGSFSASLDRFVIKTIQMTPA